MTPTSIPCHQFVTNSWQCHGTLSSAGCVLHLGFSSLRSLTSAGASTSCRAATSHSHLPWLIVASSSLPPASPPPLLRWHASVSLCPFCPLSAPADCHIAASCCAVASCQLASGVRRRQSQHCRHHRDPLLPAGGVLVTTKSLVVVSVARASACVSSSCSHLPQPVAALPPVRLGLRNSTIP
jgi:hypothetical protein